MINSDWTEIALRAFEGSIRDPSWLGARENAAGEAAIQVDASI
jgi:hypothetical protein